MQDAEPGAEPGLRPRPCSGGRGCPNLQASASPRHVFNSVTLPWSSESSPDPVFQPTFRIYEYLIHMFMRLNLPIKLTILLNVLANVWLTYSRQTPALRVQGRRCSVEAPPAGDFQAQAPPGWPAQGRVRPSSPPDPSALGRPKPSTLLGAQTGRWPLRLSFQRTVPLYPTPTWCQPQGRKAVSSAPIESPAPRSSSPPNPSSV